jgi:hypothetical protein
MKALQQLFYGLVGQEGGDIVAAASDIFLGHFQVGHCLPEPLLGSGHIYTTTMNLPIPGQSENKFYTKRHSKIEIHSIDGAFLYPPAPTS